MPGRPLIVATLVGCGLSDADLLVPADATRAGAGGEDGAYGALAIEFGVQARVTERMRVQAVVPADADGVPIAGGFPEVVFVQGGFVDVAHYDWLAGHLATRGYAVILPWHALNLAIFQTGNAVIAAQAVVDHPPEVLRDVIDGDRRAIGGHSLGGVVASSGFVQEPGFDALFLLASYPADGTPAENAGDRPVLSLVGSDDGSDALTLAEPGAQRFPGDVWFGVVDGLNHYGWTDDASRSDLASDGTAGRPLVQSRPDALAVLDAWLDAVLLDDADAAARLDQSFSGVEHR